MTNAKLIILSSDQPEREVELYGEASVGRAPDNSICIDDQAVSQYHAIIERRGDEFWLSDFGSTNGTTLNSEPITTERRLHNGDLISVGGTASIAFHSDEELPQSRHAAAEIISTATPDDHAASQSAYTASTPRTSPLLIVAAVVAGIAIAGGAVFLALSFVSNSDSSVRVLSPETGATIRGPQTIRIEAESEKDIDEVIYLLDGIEFASAEHPPFEVTLDPAQLDTKVRNLKSGNHVLTVTVQDKEGNKKPQSETVLLAFESKPDAEEVKETNDTTDKQTITRNLQSGASDVVPLSRNLAATISGKSWYDFDSQFADGIRRSTNSYRVNVMDDASRYRRQIGSAFNSKGLPPAIGFVMALSESRFKEDAANADQKIGFWQVPRQIALEQGYITPDESSAALKDVKRSAEIAAAYINDLVNAFGGMDNFMYAIACYGMPLSQAAKVRARLEEIDPGATDRKDFWRMMRSGVVARDGADRVARFFAAGIVGENPQMFGLNGRPLSSLY
ncbi:MAG TPA: FHA domain-containing protein [Blastocatellia bacterium]|nr:FHA domain-containing protein [Blastocatellia bacterium]